MKSVSLLLFSEETRFDCTLPWATLTQSEHSRPDKEVGQQGKCRGRQTDVALRFRWYNRKYSASELCFPLAKKIFRKF